MSRDDIRDLLRLFGFFGILLAGYLLVFAFRSSDGAIMGEFPLGAGIAAVVGLAGLLVNGISLVLFAVASRVGRKSSSAKHDRPSRDREEPT